MNVRKNHNCSRETDDTEPGFYSTKRLPSVWQSSKHRTHILTIKETSLQKNYAGNFSDGQPKKLQVFDLCSSFLKRKIAFSRHRDRMKYPDAIPKNLDKESYKRPTEIPSSGLRFLSKDYLFKNSFDLFIQQTLYERIDIETAPAFYSFCKMNRFYQCK